MVKKRSRGTEGINNILGKVINNIEKRGPGRGEKILKAWQKVVGEKASSHSRPVGLKKKVLAIEVDSSTWIYELTLRKREILNSLKKELGENKILDIRFRMGDIS